MTHEESRTLVLFRHAKSAWPDMADHERPLAPRGRRDAPVMGAWLRDAGLVPDRVLCSTARRARETWQLAEGGLGAAPPVLFERGVYESAAPGLLALIRGTPAAVRTLLVIGHNPTIEDLALMLAVPQPGRATPAPGDGISPAPGDGISPAPGDGISPAPGDGVSPAPDAGTSALDRMRVKFPTAAIAVLEFAGTWADLAAGQARLTAFVIPRDLAGAI
jgi:phosphohistidine phosphatase